MNERISEIWDQAAKASALLRSGENSWETQKAFIEKFAQLIVQECIGIAYEYDEPKLSGPGMIIGNRIEEHFGVEE